MHAVLARLASSVTRVACSFTFVFLSMVALVAPVRADRSIDSLTKPGKSVEPATVRSSVESGRAGISDLIYLPAPAGRDLEKMSVAHSTKEAPAVGVVRELDAPYRVEEATSPVWTRQSDGSWVWAIAVQSAGARGVRIQLSSMQLPEGAYFIVYGKSDPAGALGPFDRKLALSAPEFWTPTVFGERVVLECHIPAGADPASVEFVINRVVHQSLEGDAARALEVLYCQSDVNCADPSWRSVGNGVAHYTFISEGVSYICTGSLLNNTAQDYTDYFLTANHCVANQAEANTIECYWFYQTSACNGAAPSRTRSPRTAGGAIYLAGQTRAAGNDFAFMMLRAPAAAGAVYLGWTTTMPANGSFVRSIHHPDGSFKRISYGTKSSQDANYLDVDWTTGTTEAGSSGGPLFDSSRLVIGQLWGGVAGCVGGYSEFGRFDVTYPVIKKWIDPAASPLNNDFANAIRLRGNFGKITTSNAGANKQSGEPNHAGRVGGKSIWWIWTAPFSASTAFSTFGSSFDTVLGVYQGNAVNALSAIVSNDDSNGLQSRVTFNAVQGATYRIAVDGFNTASGEVVLAWGQSAVSTLYHVPVSDFGGPFETDLSVFNPATGGWYIRPPADTNIILWNKQWGWSTAKPVIGDFDGEGAFDLAVFDTAGGYWYVHSVFFASTVAWKNQWGWSTAKPVAGDFNGDGKWDQAVFDTAGGYWYIRNLAGEVILWKDQWGWSTARPIPGDYNADGRWDQGVVDIPSGRWYIKTITGGVIAWNNQWGWSTARAVPGDYNGDGSFDQAVYDNATGDWFIKTLGGTILAWRSQWGWPGAKPMSGDFDGDGVYDLAVVDTGTGRWYIRKISGQVIAWNVNWGWAGATFPTLGD